MMTCEVFPEFYNFDEPTAKRKHACCECSSPILKGEKHFKCTGKWDGQIQTFRQHLICMEACMFIRDQLNGHECIAFGDLTEAFGELRREIDKNHEKMKPLRHMMAIIKNRERRRGAA